MRFTRRGFLAAGAGLAFAPARALGQAVATPITRAIPASGERIPVLGMGTWITFNVGTSRTLREKRLEVLRTFFAHGGALIDSSPMYGTSEAVVGWCLERLADTDGLIAATKVWTPLGGRGREQMAESHRLWGRARLDLMQIHNLVNWETHLETLRAAKAAGTIRYIGITTSHGQRHAEMERIMRHAPIDFVQFTYNILDRDAEARLLPLAAERRLAVIINRPFRQKALISALAGKPLPAWARMFGATTWAQFLLAFVAAHPAVTCVIPATSRADHMAENMHVLRGPLPDDALRRRMIAYVQDL